MTVANRMSAQILRDSQGYYWENPDEWTPEDKGYPDELMLRPVSYPKMSTYVETHDDFPAHDYYDPFVAEPALYRIFAELDGTAEPVLRFANQYGDISPIHWLISEGGTTLREWHDGMNELRHAIKLADQFLAEAAKRTVRTKVVEATLRLVRDIVGTIEVEVKPISRRDGITLQMVATNLLDAMKLQLVDAITQQKRYRTCAFCDKPFELTPQVNRSDRLFCSDNCRVKAYQRRKKEVQGLAEQGRTLKQIHDATGVERTQIKAWIAEFKTKQEKRNG